MTRVAHKKAAKLTNNKQSVALVIEKFPFKKALEKKKATKNCSRLIPNTKNNPEKIEKKLAKLVYESQEKDLQDKTCTFSQLELAAIKPDGQVVAQALHAQEQDQVFSLIRKLNMRVKIRGNKSEIIVGEGIFSEARIQLTASENALLMNVENISEAAKSLLLKHQNLLSERLMSHEINFFDLRFL